MDQAQKERAQRERADEFWTHGRGGPLAKLRPVLHGLVTFTVWGWAILYGELRLGLLHEGLYVSYSLLLVPGQCLIVAIHEFGHALVALAVGFRFRSLNIGPLTTWKHPGEPRRYKFDANRILNASGYMGAVPGSGLHVRSNAILVVFAGPFAALMTALCLWLLCFSLQDTRWAGWWHLAAMVGALGVADFVVNLLPIGYSDGTMLWHLILWTEKGKQLYSKFKTSTLHDDASHQRHQFNFAAAVEMRRKALEEVLARGDTASLDLARAYLAFGSAQAEVHSNDEAERNLKKAVEVLESCHKVPPSLEAASLEILYMVLKRRSQMQEAESVSQRALLAFERWKDAAPEAAERAQAALGLAQIHLFSKNLPQGVEVIDEAVEKLPDVPEHCLLRANLLMFRASCEFGMGHPQRGLEDASVVESILQSHRIPEEHRQKALRRLYALGLILAKGGQSTRAAALILEAAEGFEKCGIDGYAAGVRISAASILRLQGKFAEAEAALPQPASVAAFDLSRFLAEQAGIRLATDHVPDAIEGFEAALRAANTPSHRALRQADLAYAYCVAGRIEESEVLAQSGKDALTAENNPEASGALLTLALIAWRKGEGSARAYFEQTLSTLDVAPLLQPATKALALEQFAIRLERSGRHSEALETRDAAQLYWRLAGVEECAQAVQA